MEKEMLRLILDKLDTISEEQNEMKQDIADIKKEQKEMKQDIADIKKEQKEMKQDIMKLKSEQQSIKADILGIKKDIREIKSLQGTVEEFIASAEIVIEEDHRFIQNLKKAIGE